VGQSFFNAGDQYLFNAIDGIPVSVSLEQASVLLSAALAALEGIEGTSRDSSLSCVAALAVGSAKALIDSIQIND